MELNEKQLRTFARHIMPDIYEAQAMFNAWDRCLRRIGRENASSQMNSSAQITIGVNVKR